MDTKRLLLAIVVAYAVVEGVGFLVHAVWLQETYQAYASLWRPEADFRSKMWIMFLADLAWVAALAYIYTRGMEAKPWVGQGLRFGLLVCLLTVVPFTLGNYVVFPIPDTLLVTWLWTGVATTLLAALIVAGICQKKA